MSSAVDDDQDDIEANGTDDCTDEELTRVTDAPRGRRAATGSGGDVRKFLVGAVVGTVCLDVVLVIVYCRGLSNHCVDAGRCRIYYQVLTILL